MTMGQFPGKYKNVGQDFRGTVLAHIFSSVTKFWGQHFHLWKDLDPAFQSLYTIPSGLLTNRSEDVLIFFKKKKT